MGHLAFIMKLFHFIRIRSPICASINPQIFLLMKLLFEFWSIPRTKIITNLSQLSCSSRHRDHSILSSNHISPRELLNLSLGNFLCISLRHASSIDISDPDIISRTCVIFFIISLLLIVVIFHWGGVISKDSFRPHMFEINAAFW